MHVSHELKNYVQRLSISELFDLQRYILDTIESKCVSPLKGLKEVKLEHDTDSDDFILAELDNSNGTNEGSQREIVDSTAKAYLEKNELSSPLKFSQNSHVTDLDDSQPEAPISTNYLQPPVKRKLKVESFVDVNYKRQNPGFTESNGPTRIIETSLPQINFNNNPLTGKAWILEDFLPNREAPQKKRRNRVLEDFSMKIKTESNFAVEDDLNNNFDNLRHRSPSPPGYGRLDFPTTQERKEDKTKSQSIIKEKTLYRFMSATNNKLPSYMREFLFKKHELNEIVDNGNFTWSDDKLKLFSR
ncbi:DNA endonuclease SAE2 [Nakaseomyces bracarensis]|uniref:DNA endonuclease SAE2 n=1 Tax=Nakaseomyces bracarensis TaxID=273131 RepID=A0ABR4P0D6_9SACH